MSRAFLAAAIVSLLLAYRATAEQRVINFAPLREAILNDDAAQVKTLLQADPLLRDVPLGDAASPLHLAARRDASKSAAVLIEAGADLYARDDNGQLPLDIPPGETLNATRKQLRDVNKARNEFLDAVGKRDIPRVKELLAADPSLARSRDIGDGWSAVMMACHFGDAALLQTLLDANATRMGSDFNNRQEAVAVCATEGKADCLRLLIASKHPVNTVCRVNYGRLPMEMNALHIASWKGHTEVVKLLLETKQIDPNARATSYAMFSPLHFAATEGHTEIIQLLLAAGADTNAVDGRRGINALQMAQAGKHEAAVDVLKGK